MDKDYVKTVSLSSGKMDVEIRFRSVKNLRLRIDPKSGRPVLSVPKLMSRKNAETFLDSALPWLEEHVKEGKEPFFSLPSQLRNGDSVLLLGSRRNLFVLEEIQEKIAVGDFVILTCTETRDPSRIAEAYKTALKEFALAYMTAMTKAYYPIIESKYPMPEIGIKDMSSMWGNANPSKNRINYSLHLIKAPEKCIRSVVVHELCHYFKMDHSDEFYKAVRTYMPDYDKWHKALRDFVKNN